MVVRLTAKGAKERERKGEESLGRVVLDSAYRVHSALGPGLLESAYEACLAHDIAKHADVEWHCCCQCATTARKSMQDIGWIYWYRDES